MRSIEEIRKQIHAAKQSNDGEFVDIYMSHSNDGLMDYCPRKFEFAQIYKKIPPIEMRDPEAEALRIGTITHEAAQAWLRTRHMNPAAALDAAYYTLALLWDYNRSAREESIRPLGAAAQLMHAMDSDPWWRDWELCEIDNFGLAIEVPFRIEHISPEIPRGYRIFTQGKADAIMRNRRTGEVRMVDFKTTTMPQKIWPALYRFSDQAPIYDVPVKRMLNQPLGKTKATYYMLSYDKPVDIPDESNAFQQFRPIDDYEFSTDFLPVKAMTFEYSESDIADLLRDKNERVKRLIKYLKEGYFPRRSHGCVMYNNPCQYFKVCPKRDSEALKSWFEFEEWDTHKRVYEPVWTFQSEVL